MPTARKRKPSEAAAESSEKKVKGQDASSHNGKKPPGGKKTKEATSKPISTKTATRRKSVAVSGNSKKASSVAPKTMKERILAVLSENNDKLLGLASVKKCLIAKFNLEASKSFNTQVVKALRGLEEDEGRMDFGKTGGSYHAGPNSPAFKKYRKREEEKEQERKDALEHEDELKCPFCNGWNSEITTLLDEDSIARGSIHRCQHCREKFYTWISDGYHVGHPVEYKYSH
jgi:transcription elongation factor Elf1